VLVATEGPAAVAAKKATSTIPIVFGIMHLIVHREPLIWGSAPSQPAAENHEARRNVDRTVSRTGC
jgi:hypothetical protein